MTRSDGIRNSLKKRNSMRAQREAEQEYLQSTIYWLYREYKKICSFTGEKPMQLGPWLRQEIDPAN